MSKIVEALKNAWFAIKHRKEINSGILVKDEDGNWTRCTGNIPNMLWPGVIKIIGWKNE